MADYLVNSEDLTAVADAIRAKGGTDAQLVFPGGFTSAIQALAAGGGLTISETNLHDASTDTEGYYLENGAEAAYSGWRVTDYIPIEAGVVYAFFNAMENNNNIIKGGYSAKYNTAKEYIGKLKGSVASLEQNSATLWVSDVDGFIRFSGVSAATGALAVRKCTGTVSFAEATS